MASDSSSPSSQDSDSRNTGYQPGEDRWTRWRNWFYILAGQMTDEGKEQYRQDAYKRHEATDCRRCEKQRDYLLSYSPVIRYMRDNINKLGADLNSENIHCRRCDGMQSGGFDPHIGIKLCANHMRNRGHVEDTLAHEMIHAWDHLRFKVDWENDLRHAACAEIRASSLSGECRFMREFFTRGQWKLSQQHQECVKRRAVNSVRARDFCRDKAQAVKAVNEVWESCFNDPRPFDEIYR